MTRFRPGPRLDERVAAKYAVPEARRLADQLADRVRANAPNAGIWITAHDERVRPTHVEADGQTIPDNLRYILTHPSHGGEELAQAPRDPDLSIGNRINCFPGWVDVEAVRVRGSIRAPYRGPLVHLYTASGGYFACTPNHPLLTDRGWVAAGQLDVGDHLVQAGISDLCKAGGLRVEPDVEDDPPTLDEVHRALTQTCFPQRVPRVAVDLYGDPVDGDVEVVATHRKLLVHGEAPSAQRIGELLLPPAHRADLSPRLGFHLLLRGASTAAGLVRCAGQLLALLRRGARHTESQRLPATAALHAGLGKQAADRETADAVRTGQRLLRLTDSVTLDELVDVYMRDWAGHVYTLSTDIGAYTVAGGYVAANCRCIAGSLPGLIAEHVHASDVVLRGATAAATVSVRFPRIVESENPGPDDGGGGWLRQSVQEVAATRTARSR